MDDSFACPVDSSLFVAFSSFPVAVVVFECASVLLKHPDRD